VNSLPKKLQEKLQARTDSNSFRQLINAEGLVDFTSNDYLGFAQDRILYKKADAWLFERSKQQNGAAGSRLLSGNLGIHLEVEQQLAGWYESPAALLYNSGYVANLALMSSLPQRGDLVLYDENVHASIREGLQLCQAKTVRFAHNDIEALDQAFQRNKQGSVYLITESVYSMDGSMPDLKSIDNWVTNNKALWILDEAHATGTQGEQGRGLGQSLNCFARLMTFGKAMGCHGAVVLGSDELRDYLINFSRSFIYTTSLPPHALAAIAVAHTEIATSNAIADLNQRLLYFKSKIEELGMSHRFLPSNTAIQSCIVRGNTLVKEVAATLRQEGFDVRPILSPTVEEGKERLRICIHTYNNKQEIDELLLALSQLL